MRGMEGGGSTFRGPGRTTLKGWQQGTRSAFKSGFVEPSRAGLQCSLWAMAIATLGRQNVGDGGFGSARVPSTSPNSNSAS